ncbi:NAD(P)H-binding protein [Conexibacter sp. JD483]|uniref:NAD(P)H-binding protein n=1 Tax=unclassified Conexibacter TaxID=2627773 RepID=UPI00272642AA|nr:MULTISPECIES: NAD(P)H-binding protein [unclassified Conexibacter]MDO8185896.1 NAD(P)H-binding protein [Conexibacter sp. CPCC 205706]MDO8199387.1 NAD(P)H-binding protein [Conexibacter sp. CPCC 205762]MDR9371287.1 NAD(P)H-binding protein [Conexibacter sp. JD483]
MRILITGVSGFVGSRLVPRLRHDGHELRGFARDAARVAVDVPLVLGDAVSGAGLDAALDGVEVAYFLIHSMEPPPDGDRAAFEARELASAERFATAARAAGVRRIVYLGGLVPTAVAPSAHLASRLVVEQTLLAAVPDPLALRASIVIGAGSRSFRFLVRLIERMPVLALPGWRDFRTQPVDERDVVETVARAATAQLPAGAPRSLDLAGPDVVSYRELIERIRDHMLLDRPVLPFDPPAPASIASRVAAAIAGERHELVGPLMAGLTSDLLPRAGDTAALLDVRLHRLDAAIEHALREWERDEPLAAR